MPQEFDPSAMPEPGFARTFNSLLVQESGGRQFNPDGSTVLGPKTPAGQAVGIAQIMPSTGPTAARLAGLPWDESRLYKDEGYNRALGQAYLLRNYMDFGDMPKALSAYNAGPGRLRGAMAQAEADGAPHLWQNYLSPETQKYAPTILARAGNMPADTGVQVAANPAAMPAAVPRPGLVSTAYAEPAPAPAARGAAPASEWDDNSPLPAKGLAPAAAASEWDDNSPLPANGLAPLGTAPMTPEQVQAQSDRAALGRVGGTIARGAGIAGAALHDFFTVPVRGVEGAINTALRLPNAFGANIPYFPDNGNLTKMFPRLSAALAAPSNTGGASGSWESDDQPPVRYGGEYGVGSGGGPDRPQPAAMPAAPGAGPEEEDGFYVNNTKVPWGTPVYMNGGGVKVGYNGEYMDNGDYDAQRWGDAIRAGGAPMAAAYGHAMDYRSRALLANEERLRTQASIIHDATTNQPAGSEQVNGPGGVPWLIRQRTSVPDISDEVLRQFGIAPGSIRRTQPNIVDTNPMPKGWVGMPVMQPDGEYPMGNGELWIVKGGHVVGINGANK